MYTFLFFQMENKEEKFVRLGTFNTHNHSSTQVLQEVVSLFRNYQVDVIGLQEITQPSATKLCALMNEGQPGAPWSVAHIIADHCGNATLSRYPITWSKGGSLLGENAIAHKLGRGEMRSAIFTKLDTPIGVLNHVTTHLDHIHEERRVNQFHSLHDFVQKYFRGPPPSGDQKKPSVPGHILVGDFNALTRADYTSTEWDEIVKVREDSRWPAPVSTLFDLLIPKFYSHDASSFPAPSSPSSSLPSVSSPSSSTENEFGFSHHYNTRLKPFATKGTCRFNTRIDYILSSADMQSGSEDRSFRFRNYHVVSVPYSISDHSLVITDLVLVEEGGNTSSTPEAKSANTKRKNSLSLSS